METKCVAQDMFLFWVRRKVDTNCHSKEQLLNQNPSFSRSQLHSDLENTGVLNPDLLYCQTHSFPERKKLVVLKCAIRRSKFTNLLYFYG